MKLAIGALRSSVAVAGHRNVARAAGMVALFGKRPAIASPGATVAG